MLEVTEQEERTLRETRPEVFLIARPSIELEGMRGYLESVGGESWLEMRLGGDAGGLNPGETLVEFGGRACYRSWEPGLNPNVTRIRTDQQEYFQNILRSAHGSVLEHANYSFAIAPGPRSARRACGTCGSPTSASASRRRSSQCASRSSTSSSSSRSSRSTPPGSSASTRMVFPSTSRRRSPRRCAGWPR